MSEHVYFLTLCLPLATILIVFGMRYRAAVLQARARIAADDTSRDLAARSAASQSETAAALAAMAAALADIQARLAGVEKILKAVE